MNRKIVKIAVLGLLITCLAFVLTSCGGRVYPTSFDELDGLRAGAVTGQTDDMIIESMFPNSEISYFNNQSDELTALSSNKIDYFLADELMLGVIQESVPNVTAISKSVYDMDYVMAFQKNSAESDALRAQINDFFTERKADGTIEKITQKWGEDGSKAEFKSLELTGENGTITVATAPLVAPFAFVRDGKTVGMDVEILELFCKEYGYDLEFESSDFAGIIPAVTSGKVDLGTCAMAYTEERAKAVNFSIPYVEKTGYVPIVMTKEKSKLSISGIKESFYKTFIKESRWKLILSGMLTTLAISLSAGILGSILGFAIYMLCRRGNRPLNKFFDGFAWLYGGLPIVVVLMILYYIVFGQTQMSGAVVSVIAFTVSLALSVYSMLKTSVQSIDIGQTEGAYSLGFTDTQTFFNIILPQAMTQFIPNFKKTLVAMVQGTAIVGYIAVQDLTKMSDVIRARTYEAFFSLIVTAIIYLLLGCVLTGIIKLTGKKFEPKERSDEEVLRKFGK